MTVQKGPVNKLSKYSFLIIVVLALLVLSYSVRNPLVQEEKKLTYSEFLSYLDKEQITQVTIVNNGSKVHGKLKDGKKFLTDAPDDPDLVKTLRKAGVPFSAENPGFKENFTSFFTVIIVPALIILVFWFLIIRQAQMGGSQAMSFGRSRAKILTDNLPKITFNDVAGVNEAKEELEEIVEFLKSPKRFQLLGAKIPKGVLLVGAPGTGKTLLARAIAGEAGVPFLHMSGSDFVEMFVGVGASRVRDLFEQAKKNAPCLVFVDEIDAVGRQRGAGLGGGHDEREQTLNQLLVEMDGFDPNIGVILLAATNRPDVLDPALLRPGRFDRRIVVDRPDLNGRTEILQVHARNKPMDNGVDLEVIARRTPGFTGADLENVLNEAAILAARENLASVNMSHLEEAIERVVAGPERKSRLLSEKERKNIAYHEAGHAIVARLLPGSDPVHKISILPRGMALGYTLQLPSEDKYSELRGDLINDICVFLGGRAAEKLMIGEISTGATNDIERATKIARRMVCEFGMSDELGPIAFGRKESAVFLGRDFSNERDYSEAIAAKIDSEVRHIIDDCYSKVEEMLKTNIERLRLVAEKLVEHETLEGVLLESLLDGKTLSSDEIARLESERRQKIEEENKKKQEDKKNAENAKANGDGKKSEEDSNSDSPASSGKEPQEAIAFAGGLLGTFYSLLEKTFEETFMTSLASDFPDDKLDSLEKTISEKLNPDLEIIKSITNSAVDKSNRAGIHLKAAIISAKHGRPELIVDELMAALQNCPDGSENNVRNILISSISYFRIINEELKRNKLQFSALMDNGAVLDKIDNRYAEWEKRAARTSASFHHMTGER